MRQSKEETDSARTQPILHRNPASMLEYNRFTNGISSPRQQNTRRCSTSPNWRARVPNHTLTRVATTPKSVRKTGLPAGFSGTASATVTIDRLTGARQRKIQATTMEVSVSKNERPWKFAFGKRELTISRSPKGEQSLLRPRIRSMIRLS
jgi:hypothetical protein